MISKIISSIPSRKPAKVFNQRRVYSNMNNSSQNNTTASNAKRKMATVGGFLLNKIKSAGKFINNLFTEESRSKRAGIKPLKDKDLKKFIKDTEIYDPNSPDYIHGNYSVPRPKKSK